MEYQEYYNDNKVSITSISDFVSNYNIEDEEGSELVLYEFISEIDELALHPAQHFYCFYENASSGLPYRSDYLYEFYMNIRKQFNFYEYDFIVLREKLLSMKLINPDGSLNYLNWFENIFLIEIDNNLEMLLRIYMPMGDYHNEQKSRDYLDLVIGNILQIPQQFDGDLPIVRLYDRNTKSNKD